MQLFRNGNEVRRVVCDQKRKTLVVRRGLEFVLDRRRNALCVLSIPQQSVTPLPKVEDVIAHVQLKRMQEPKDGGGPLVYNDTMRTMHTRRNRIVFGL